VLCEYWIERDSQSIPMVEVDVTQQRLPNFHLQFLLLVFAGWINRRQQAVIEYLQAENQSLREQLGKKRIRWTDAQRRRLAEKAKAIGRSTLAALGTVSRLTRCSVGTATLWLPGTTVRDSGDQGDLARNLTSPSW
jgi:hypothetical protein